jgi:uncharacterized protein YecE (DUF72 family)
MIMIYVGTSGYSYKDWVGPFYPADLPSGGYLNFYVQHLPAVEVDYTYYRMPDPHTLAGMARRTPPEFRFAVKATSLLTHEREAREKDFAEYRRGVEPLVEAGKLAAVLAQFPYSFQNSEPHRAYLAHLRASLPDLPLVVEFRNVSWIIEPIFELLRELGLGFCSVDQPRFSRLVPPVALATSEVGYVRFHGRNAAQWWTHEEAWQRYDYLYDREELAEWVPKVVALAAETRETLVFFNNHYQAQAVQNAQTFTDLLAEAGLEVARAVSALGGAG